MSKALDFLREVRVELSKVVWPTRQQTIQLTIVVILVTLFVGFFLGLIDLGLTKILNILLALKK
jgi:preprotein translocase subunit SecE